MTLSERIKRSREARGLSLSGLARRADISKSYLHAIEGGNVENPSFAVVMRLAWELDEDPLRWWKPPNGHYMTQDHWDGERVRQRARIALERALTEVERGDDGLLRLRT